MDGERTFALESGSRTVSDAPQVIRDGLQNPLSGLRQLLCQPVRTFIRFVDDHPPIHHEEDTAWRGDSLSGIQP